MTSPSSGQGPTPLAIAVATVDLVPVPAHGPEAAPPGESEGRQGHHRRTTQSHVQGQGQGLVPLVPDGGDHAHDLGPHSCRLSARLDELRPPFNHPSCNCTLSTINDVYRYIFEGSA